MFCLIELATEIKILTRPQISPLGGPNQWGVDAGYYVWLEVPQGELPEDCILNRDGAPKLVVSHALKDARIAAQTAEANRRAQMAAFKQRFLELDAQTDITAGEVKELLRKLFRYLKLYGIFD